MVNIIALISFAVLLMAFSIICDATKEVGLTRLVSFFMAIICFFGVIISAARALGITRF